jgi:uncharacterized protein YbjT (DUF2867 family)
MIVVTTPTGSIGHQVLDRILAGPEPVRVIVRDPSRLPPPVRDRVDVVRGSMDDPDVVSAAFAGADSVFWLVPPDPRAESIQDHVIDFVRPLCAAINRQGVERVVGISSLGRGTARHAGQISAIFAMDDLIADVAAALLLDHTWSGQESVPILGPEDLSQDDMARIMSEVLERPVRFQHVSAEDYRATLTGHGMSDAWAQGLVDMAAAVDRGIYDDTVRTPRSSTPTGFRQWCDEVLKPAVL